MGFACSTEEQLNECKMPKLRRSNETPSLC